MKKETKKFSLDRMLHPKVEVDPVRAELRLRRVLKIQQAIGGFQRTKLVIAALFAIAFNPMAVALISPYATYYYAEAALNGFLGCATLLLFLYPTHTPAWRTLGWCYVAMITVGVSTLPLGWGTMTLAVAGGTGFIILALRINETGRKLWRMFQDFRTLR